MENEGIRPEGIIGVAKDFEGRIRRIKAFAYPNSFHGFCESRKDLAYPEVMRIRKEMIEVGETIYKAVSIRLSETDASKNKELKKQYEIALEKWGNVVYEVEEFTKETSLSGDYGSKKTIEEKGDVCILFE